MAFHSHPPNAKQVTVYNAMSVAGDIEHNNPGFPTNEKVMAAKVLKVQLLEEIATNLFNMRPGDVLLEYNM